MTQTVKVSDLFSPAASAFSGLDSFAQGLSFAIKKTVRYWNQTVSFTNTNGGERSTPV